MARTALLAGATGLVGGHLLETLRNENAYQRIIVLTRRPIKLANPRNIDVRFVNFDHLSPADVAGGDDVFCALGTTIKKAGSQPAFRKVDFEAIVNLARATLEAGAKRFTVVSSVGADPKSSNFYLRVKGETEQAIAALGFEAIHLMRPSLLLGTRDESRTGEAFARTIMPTLNWALVGSLSKYRAIPALTVAQAMVHAAQSNITGNHVHEFREIVALAQRSLATHS